MLLKPNHYGIANNKMDCCVGNNHVNHGIWYISNANDAEIYCEFCVENNCVDKNSIYRIDVQTENYACHCKKDHPRVTRLVCPLCPAKRYAEYFINLCDNTNDIVFNSKNKICSRCGIDTIDDKYCNTCAHTLKCCTNCGDSIRSGNKYIAELSNIVTRITDLHRKKIWKWRDMTENNYDPAYMNEYVEKINSFYIEIMKLFDKIYENIVNKYRNFSATQILQHLILHEKLN